MTPRLPRQERLDKEITRDEFELSFAYPIDQASVMLSVGPTALKTYCRSIGIKRWPYRKVIRCQQLAKKLNSGMGSRADHKTLIDQMEQLTTPPTSILWRHLGVDMVAAVQTYDIEPRQVAQTLASGAVASPNTAAASFSTASFSNGTQSVAATPSLEAVFPSVNTTPTMQNTDPSMALLQALQLYAASAQPKQPEAPLPTVAELLGALAAQQPAAAPPVATDDNSTAIINALLSYCTQLGAC